jgi:hypothetical protein
LLLSIPTKKKNFIADDLAAAFDFYHELLGTAVGREVTIDLEALGMPSFDLSGLDSPFLEDEVWNTIKTIPLDKAPGPDGSQDVSTNHVGLPSKLWQQFPVFGRINSEILGD